ncbi:MAG: flippase-like domain-containing protein [bacterium]|nr:flippase-like domain-containing protein [bacterium]
MKSKIISFIKISVPWIITGLIFFYLFSKINIPELKEQLLSAHVAYLSTACILALSSLFLLNALIFYIVSDGLKLNLTYKECLYIKLGSFSLKAVLPLKIGEVSSVLYLKKKHAVSLPIGGLSVFLDQFYSLLFIIILGFAGYLGMADPETRFFLILIAAISLLIMLLFRNIPVSVLRFLSKYSSKLRLVLHNFSAVLNSFKLWHYIAIFFLSLLNEFAKIFIFWLLLASLSLDVPLMLIVFVVPLSIIITFLPITPMGLGTREAAIVYYLSNYISPEQALNAALLFSFFRWIIPTGIGLFFTRSFIKEIQNN